MSLHLHVVSAENSQRNSSAVSECREEVNNAIILCLQQLDAPKINLPNLTEHQTIQAQYLVEGSDAPFIYAYDRKRTWVLYFLARQQFTVSEIKEYAIETRN
jgi:hypothetical protein